MGHEATGHQQRTCTDVHPQAAPRLLQNHYGFKKIKEIRKHLHMLEKLIK